MDTSELIDDVDLLTDGSARTAKAENTQAGELLDEMAGGPRLVLNSEPSFVGAMSS